MILYRVTHRADQRMVKKKTVNTLSEYNESHIITNTERKLEKHDEETWIEKYSTKAQPTKEIAQGKAVTKI